MAIDPNMKILIVDDHRSMVAVIRTLLKQIDLSTTDEASDGTAALVRLRGQDFDLVISDCDMEPMGGLELLTEIRSDAHLKDIPVVLVTADTVPGVAERALGAGAAGFIVKPFDAAALKAQLEDIFEKS